MSVSNIVLLAKEMSEIKAKLDSLKKEKAELEKQYDILRIGKIPESMDSEGINNITIEGIGRVVLTSDVYASIPAPCREAAYEWLRQSGHGGVIKDTINSGTFKALVKALMKKGETIPDGVAKIIPYTRASITKV